MAKQAWKDLEILLQKYLAHYGGRAGRNDGGGTVDPSARVDNPRNGS
jgi:hypothetical protein